MSDEQGKQGGLSVKTLLIAAASSAAASLIVPMLWEPGTVFAAAMTPIVVTIISELLRRPADTVSAVRVRRTRDGTAIIDRPDEPFDPLAPPSHEELAALPREHATTPAVHRRRRLTGRQWQLALTTGLVAFVGVVALFTASELIAGDAVSGKDSRTTFFGGSGKHKRDATPSPTATPDERDERPERTPSPTPTPTSEPEATPTPTATPEATPTPTPTPTPTATPDPALQAPPPEPTPVP